MQLIDLLDTFSHLICSFNFREKINFMSLIRKIVLLAMYRKIENKHFPIDPIGLISSEACRKILLWPFEPSFSLF